MTSKLHVETAMSLSVVKLVNEYAGRFDELEDRVREMRRDLEEKIDGLIRDLEYEAREALEGAVEVGLLSLDLKATVFS